MTRCLTCNGEAFIEGGRRPCPVCHGLGYRTVDGKQGKNGKDGAPAFLPSRGEVPAAVDEQEFLRILANVQEAHEAGLFSTKPHVGLLLRRIPRVMEELVALRADNARLRGEAAVVAQSEGLFSVRITEDGPRHRCSIDHPPCPQCEALIEAEDERENF